MLFLHVFLCTMCIQCPRRPEDSRNQKIPGTGLTYDCELSRRCWELSSSPLEKVVSTLNFWDISPTPLEQVLTSRITTPPTVFFCRIGLSTPDFFHFYRDYQISLSTSEKKWDLGSLIEIGVSEGCTAILTMLSLLNGHECLPFFFFLVSNASSSFHYIGFAP